MTGTAPPPGAMMGCNKILRPSSGGRSSGAGRDQSAPTRLRRAGPHAPPIFTRKAGEPNILNAYACIEDAHKLYSLRPVCVVIGYLFKSVGNSQDNIFREEIA